MQMVGAANLTRLIHPTAVIDPGAELDPTVQVGPFAVIGDQWGLYSRRTKPHNYTAASPGTTGGASRGFAATAL